MKPLVYVAGPYAKPDPIVNTRIACEAASALYESGRVVPIVPHTTMVWHLVTPRPPEHWYAYDLEVLERCDALLRLPGESSGADREVAFMQAWGKPVLWSVEQVLRWSS